VSGQSVSRSLANGRAKETEEKSGKVKELEQRGAGVLKTSTISPGKASWGRADLPEQLRTAKTDFLSASVEYADTKKDRIRSATRLSRRQKNGKR